jgi:cytochrome c-type biogenesis protein CcmH/NrfF
MNGQPQEQRIRRLEQVLLAPCCYSEPVAVHRSQAAAEMRLEIARFVKEGKSDRDIIDHYKQQYGARVLIEPEGELRFWVYLLPPVAVVIGLAIVVLVIRRMLIASRQAEQTH